MKVHYDHSNTATSVCTALLYKGSHRAQLSWEMTHTVLMARLLSWIQGLATTTNPTLSW